MISAKVIKDKKAVPAWVSKLPFNSLPKITDAAFIRDEIAFVLDDGRIVYVPLKWSKKLLKASSKQRQNFKTNGIHVFWDDVDEIIGVKNILFGKELFL